MGLNILKIVEYLKALAYLAVTVSVGYTYVNKDAMLSKIGTELKPYIEEQVSISVKEEVPLAVINALQQDNMHITIDSNQFRMFKLLLDENKHEILDASADFSDKFAQAAIRNFLTIEREIMRQDGTIFIIKGTLLGKDELGRDDWFFRVREKT